MPSARVEGVLDVVYDYERIAARFFPGNPVRSGEAGMWRYGRLLPVEPASPAPRCWWATPPCTRRPGSRPDWV